MALSSPEADRALLVEAAAAAGAIALRFFRRDPGVWEKDGGLGPVTEADLAVDRALAQRLRAARPDYGWLSEETTDGPERLSRRRVFIVDPIDGTRAFVAGETGWCVALAVVEAGRPIAAAALFPALGVLYAAARGAGATRGDRPLRASACAALDGARVVANAAMLDPGHWPGGPPRVERRFRASMIHRLCRVGEGSEDAMLTFRKVWEWDAAAGALIAEEAGCVVTDGAGAPIRFNAESARHEGLIVAPPALHAALLERRRPPA